MGSHPFPRAHVPVSMQLLLGRLLLLVAEVLWVEEDSPNIMYFLVDEVWLFCLQARSVFPFHSIYAGPSVISGPDPVPPPPTSRSFALGPSSHRNDSIL